MKLLKKSLCLLISLLYITSPALGGVDLNGDADYIDVGTSNFPTKAPLTVACWINVDDNDWDYKFFSRWNDSPYAYTFLLLWDVSDGDIDFYCKRNGTDDMYKANCNSSDISLNTWIFVCGVMDNSTNITLYINDKSFTGGDNGWNNTNIPTVPATIGAGQVGSSRNDILDGKISEVAIWDTNLSTEEVSLLYNSKVKGIQRQIKPNNLVGYWPLDDFPDGTSLDTSSGGYKDRSGNGNDGTGVDADGDSTNIAEEVLSYP